MYRILPMCASSSFYPRPIARTVRQGFSSPEWDLTKCLAYLNFREFYSSTRTVHSEGTALGTDRSETAKTSEVTGGKDRSDGGHKKASILGHSLSRRSTAGCEERLQPLHVHRSGLAAAC